MGKLEKAYQKIQSLEFRGEDSRTIDPRINVSVVLVYLISMLSVPLGHLSMLIWFALFPIISAAISGLNFATVFKQSLMILPFAALIGIFNPFLDKTVAFTIGEIPVSRGWVSFISILLRGMLAMQAIIILIESSGFTGICRALREMRVPAFLTDQLQFIYRYISVLLLEALSMRRAREARGFGRKRYPLKTWGVMTGQLFLRSIERAERINRAMLARGFNGTMPSFTTYGKKISPFNWVYLIIACGFCIALRLLNLSKIVTFNL